MTMMDTIRADAAAGVQWIERAARWLVGAAATGEASLTTMESEHPLVAEAISDAMATAKADGLPVLAIENAGNAVLNVAQEMAAAMKVPPSALGPANIAPTGVAPAGPAPPPAP